MASVGVPGALLPAVIAIEVLGALALAGKVAAISGVAGGQGRAAALQFAQWCDGRWERPEVAGTSKAELRWARGRTPYARHRPRPFPAASHL